MHFRLVVATHCRADVTELLADVEKQAELRRIVFRLLQNESIVLERLLVRVDRLQTISRLERQLHRSLGLVAALVVIRQLFEDFFWAIAEVLLEGLADLTVKLLALFLFEILVQNLTNLRLL